VPHQLTESRAIQYVTPTSYERLRTCFLQQAFVQRERTSHEGAQSSAALLGTIVHEVLQRVVDDGSLLTDVWKQSLSECWNDRLAARSEASPDIRPEMWPAFHLTAARLVTTAGRLRRLLLGLGQNSSVLTEAELSARSGRLRGRPDIILRGATHAVIDYKSGLATEVDGSTLRARYRRQLSIYALLEAETYGAWPSIATVVSLHGIDVSTPVDPRASNEDGDTAVQLMNDYNSNAPGLQPASPSEEACGQCAFASECHAFWERADMLNSVLSVRGVVTAVVRSRMGGITLSVERRGGSITDATAIIHAPDPALAASFAMAEPGREISVAGLWRDRGREAFRPGWQTSATIG
jgi:RecB family exonuclease